MLERLIWLVPLAVGLSGLWRPRAGLLLLIGCLPLFGAPPGGPYLQALEVAGVAAVLTAWRGGRLERSPLGWPAAALVVIGLLSLLPLAYLPPSWRPSVIVGLIEALPGAQTWSALYSWRAAIDMLLGWALFLAVRRAFAGRSPRPVALALLAGLATTLLVGLASFVDLIDLGGYRPVHSVDPRFRRLYSLFFLSGWLAEYIVMAAPLAFAALLEAGRRARHLVLLLAALSLTCLALTKQRGGWIAVAVQLLFLAVVLIPRWRRRPGSLRKAAVAGIGLVLMTALLVAGIGPLDPLLNRVRSIGASGVEGRMMLWSAAGQMLGERPLLGTGLGSFAPIYDELHPRGEPGGHDFRNTAHSLYLNVAAERGALGLLSLGLLGWAAVVCLRTVRPGEEALALGLAVALVGTAVYGLVQYIFHLPAIGWLLWVLLGCVALVHRAGGSFRGARAAQAAILAAVLLLPLRLVLHDRPALAGDRSFGLHQTEGSPPDTYQWIEGSAGMRLPWEGDTLVLTLANGHPRAAERPVDVAVGIEGRVVGRFTVRGGWEEHRIETGPPTKRWLVLTIRAGPTFRPFSDFRRYEDLNGSTDIRSLGVAIRKPVWQTATDQAPTAPKGPAP